MKVSGQTAVILFFLVSSTHTSWHKKVCNLGKYNTNSCLGSYPCMEEFLRCDCIPLQFAGQKFEDLCWTSLAYEVGAPVCCINVQKRQHTSKVSSNAGTNTGNLLMSVLGSTVQKRNNIKNINAIVNNERKLKPKDNRIRMIMETRSKKKTFVSKPSITSLVRTFLDSVPIPISIGTDNANQNYPQEKVATDFIDAFLHSEKESGGTEMDNDYQGSSHKSLFTETDGTFIDSALEPRATEFTDRYPSSSQKEIYTGKDNAYLRSVPAGDNIDILLSSLQIPGALPEVPENVLKISNVQGTDNANIRSVLKLSERNKQNVNLSKMLKALKCQIDRN